MNITIRARLTLLYFVVLAASFTVFFWICDYGFQHSIDATVDEASQKNLEIVERLLRTYVPQGVPVAQQELTELSQLFFPRCQYCHL